MQSSRVACLFLLALAPAAAARSGQERNAGQNAQESGANPIRRVVNMLQMMEKKIEAEAEREKQLYDKFMCYCENGKGTLSKSVADAETKMPQVGADIEEATSKLARTKEELKGHQTNRAEAKAAVATATSLREKEAAAFAAETGDLKTNLAAMTSAIKAIEKGMVGSFLQTQPASLLKRLVTDSSNLSDFDRQCMTSFLSGTQGDAAGYVPASGEITGILKEMTDTMQKNLDDATAAEKGAISDFDILMAAKTKEIDANTKAIEEKTVRVGNLGVRIVQMKEDLSDTEEALLDDKKFLANMDTDCADKKAEWEVISKTRAEEKVAIAETIKILNDDDALDLFKKTLPSPALVQVAASTHQLRVKTLTLVRQLRRSIRPAKSTPLDLIALALTGKKVNFDKVFKMIDELIAALNKEQSDDENKKDFCEKQFDFTEDKKKELNRKISGLKIDIEEATEGIATLTEELKTLAEAIAALDKQVAQAAADRKEEHEDYRDLMASDSAAKQLLAMAKNRLNKFYNPKLYKSPPKVALMEEPTATSSMALVQIYAHNGGNKEAPPPPPESFGPYAKKASESGGVLSMIDSLVADLDKEMTEAETAEKNAQQEYEEFVSDAAVKRAIDSRTVTDKENAKASLETDLVKAKSAKESTFKELMAVEEYEASLHADCDFLLTNFDLRKTARSDEIDSLNKAKAVLAGADFSFVQRDLASVRKHSLRGA